jgi:hypothetical protein
MRANQQAYVLYNALQKINVLITARRWIYSSLRSRRLVRAGEERASFEDNLVPRLFPLVLEETPAQMAMTS